MRDKGFCIEQTTFIVEELEKNNWKKNQLSKRYQDIMLWKSRIFIEL